MSEKMCALRIPDALNERYDQLARNTGRTKTFYMRLALENHIADLEDASEAAMILERVRQGGEDVVSFADWEKTQPEYATVHE
jgi:RHH-type rel operon transcriptional repressor/antitoxin RelB